MRLTPLCLHLVPQLVAMASAVGTLGAQQPDDARCAVVDLLPDGVAAETVAENTVRDIYALLDSWRDALREGNGERLTALVTETAEFWSHGAAPIRGRAALADAFAPFFGQYDLLQDFECHELVVRDDLAFMRGLERNRLLPHDGGDVVLVEQRAFSILRRAPGGQWRFSRGMTNQPPTPEAEPPNR